jgi:hypothetical protein
MVPRRLFAFGTCAAAAAAVLLTHGATAQSATGTLTGRVLWSSCIRAIPLPAVPDAQAQPSTGQAQPGVPSASGLPAGAVLVAVQGTPVNARTDETGRFSMDGVPAGQYLTIAAGPVGNAPNAIAERPNVFLTGGQTVDIGNLSLGGSGGSSISLPCRVLPGVQSAPGGVQSTPGEPQPAPDTDMPTNP